MNEGLTGKEFEVFKEHLIKANTIQLNLMLKEIYNEVTKRVVQ